MRNMQRYTVVEVSARTSFCVVLLQAKIKKKTETGEGAGLKRYRKRGK